MDRYDITVPLVFRASLFHHWKEKSISLGGKSIPLPLVGRAAPCDWWKGISIPLVGRALHCHLAGGASPAEKNPEKKSDLVLENFI